MDMKVILFCLFAVIFLGCEARESGQQSPPPVTGSSAAQVQEAAHPGKAAYDRACAGCHGETGVPTSAGASIGAGNFREGPALSGFSDDEIRTLVREGRGNMRPIPLDDDTLTNVISYIRTFTN